RLVELDESGSMVAERFDERPVLRELHDAIVFAMAIRDKDRPIGKHGDTGRPIEGLIAAAGHTGLADRQEHLALRAELEDLATHLHALEWSGSRNRLLAE